MHSGKFHDAVIRPRYAETDQMGVIYHGNYFTYFEVGRVELMRSLGFSYKKLEEEGVILPVIEVKCKYKKPILYDEVVLIRTRVKTLQGIRIVFAYEVIRETDGIVLAEGETHHAFVDAALRPLKINNVNPDVIHLLRGMLPDEN